MKIKEVLPFTMESPVVHLVQPSPAVSLGATQGDSDTEWRHGRANLLRGYISPPVHPRPPDGHERAKASFYDLRVNRSMSEAPDLSPTSSSRSKSVDDSPRVERRRREPDFEDILRELGCSSRTSDAGENEEHSVRKCSVASNDSVFYDVSLGDREVESSYTSPPVELTPRKSFSEETFNRNRADAYRNRCRIIETVRKNWRTISSDSCDDSYEEAWNSLKGQDRRRVSQMVDELLLEIYGDKGGGPVTRRRSVTGVTGVTGVTVAAGATARGSASDTSAGDRLRLTQLRRKSVAELVQVASSLQTEVKRLGGRLVKQLMRRDCLLARRDYHCDWITAYLQANSEKRSEDTRTRFSVAPAPGDSGFTQWQNGMRMVARLPEGIPAQFRKTLWLNLAEKHLASRGVQWSQVEEFCFNEFTNPDDEELGVQIVKDVHRTGCSLFCGVSGKDNQALLKRVLLAYARWNKAVGYCQGFNMLAALILQVMDKSEVDSVKVMIYLIEGVLPESYFANSLRGLSVDMAVFRDLLRLKLPALSRHFDQLQSDSKDSGTSYEPPLTNVFTMQWFLTLFCNCLPQDTVLRVWDLIFLEGNHILLSTALAIWSTLSDRIMTVESADEFYSIMGVLTREMLEFGLMDANALIKAIVSFTLPELPELREKYLYNITPWTQSVSTVARRGLRLFYSDDDTDTEEDDEKIAIATAYGLFRSPKRKDGPGGVTSPPRTLSYPDKEKIAMDISALTKQYRKLRERQKQAHVILTAACGSQGLVGPTAPPAMNHLLMGKFALVNNKGRRLGPPPGSIPPPSQPRIRQGEKQTITISGETLHWKDALEGRKPQQRVSEEEAEAVGEGETQSRCSSSSSTSTELCDDPQRSPSDSEDLSDSSALLSDKEHSTPKRTVQHKIQHPSDVIICKEEDEEAFERTGDEKYTYQKVLDVKTTENNKSSKSLSPVSLKSSSPVSSEGDEEKPQKRKLSFRIDPEELRQLDRKLSLKIVEIERRKSSAGIESEDLNSKVLFPFDRDYIHEMENKCDRDTPSSIPDDRMFSTEDYANEFDEESILVPDIITTHKPLGYRMASVEECDETKVNDSCEKTNGEGIVETQDYMDRESPEELYEGEEDDEDDQRLYTTYNFDDLFINTENKTDSTEPRESYQVGESNLSGIRPSFIESEANISSNTIMSDHPLEMNSSSYLSQKASCSTETVNRDSLLQSSFYLSDDMKAEISDLEAKREDHIPSPGNPQKILNSGNFDNQRSNESVSLQLKETRTIQEPCYISQEEKMTDLISIKTDTVSSVSPNLSDSEKALERKLANVMPKIASLSFDSNMPDVAAVASREARINSIREKYANMGQTSKEESDSEFYRCQALLRVDSKTEMDSAKLSGKMIQRFADVCNTEKESENYIHSQLFNSDSKTESGTEPAFDKIAGNCFLQLTDSCTIGEVGSSGSSMSTMNSLSSENTKETDQSVSETNKSSVQMNIKNNVAENLFKEAEHDTRINQQKLEKAKSLIRDNEDREGEEEIKRPSSASSNRRGSEVALSLILQENSQILSKIQQQSRRSSEVNLNDTSMQEKHLESPEGNNIDIRLKTDEEILLLTKAILDIDADSHKSLSVSDEKPKICEELSLFKHTSTQKLFDNVISGQQKVGGSNDMSQNKSTSKECQARTEVVMIEKQSEKNDLINESISLEKNELLPDVCKFNTDKSKGQKHKSSVGPSDKFQPLFLPRLSSDDLKDANKTDNAAKLLKESYTYSKRPSIMSPTTEVDENSPPEISALLGLQSSASKNKTIVSSLSSSEQPLTFPMAVMQSTEFLKTESKPTNIESVSDTNEDILKELEALDIKPEEVSEYTDSTAVPITPEDHFYFHKSKSPADDVLKLSSEKEKYDFPKSSLDLTPEFRGSRHCSAGYKTSSSFDVSSVNTDSYLGERRKPITRASKTVDNDDSLYMSSYKSHGRLLIEKGELEPYRSSDTDKPSNFSGEDLYDLKTTSICNRKSRIADEESAYDYRRVNSSRVNRSYSEFLADDNRSSTSTKNEPREKTLFKYKSEDYGRSMSPPHYRFSSASPVRKRLDTLTTDFSTPYSSLTRAKSPSPTYYGSSHSLSSRDSGLLKGPEHLGIDSSYEPSADCKRYSRTESLDFNPVEVRSTFAKKRADSLDTFSSDRIGDKKSPSSPQKFNPFPVRSSSRQPKELGVKLGLYLPPKSDKSPNKHVT